MAIATPIAISGSEMLRTCCPAACTGFNNVATKRSDPCLESTMRAFIMKLVRSPMPSPKPRILALDLGKKRIGMAISDPLGLTAQGLPNLVRTPKRADLAELVRQVEE